MNKLSLSEIETILAKSMTYLEVVNVMSKLRSAAREEVSCKENPDAPHGFNRNASHMADRYVCDCEFWAPEEFYYISFEDESDEW